MKDQGATIILLAQAFDLAWERYYTTAKRRPH